MNCKEPACVFGRAPGSIYCREHVYEYGISEPD